MIKANNATASPRPARALQQAKASQPEKKMSGEELSLYAVGDVRPDWPNPDSIVEMELVLPIFKQADILFGNLESPISDKGERQVCNSGRKIRPEKLSLLTDAGFDVM